MSWRPHTGHHIYPTLMKARKHLSNIIYYKVWEHFVESTIRPFLNNVLDFLREGLNKGVSWNMKVLVSTKSALTGTRWATNASIPGSQGVFEDTSPQETNLSIMGPIIRSISPIFCTFSFSSGMFFKKPDFYGTWLEPFHITWGPGTLIKRGWQRSGKHHLRFQLRLLIKRLLGPQEVPL